MPDPTTTADSIATVEMMLAARRMGLDAKQACAAMLSAVRHFGLGMQEPDRRAVAKEMYAIADELTAAGEAKMYDAAPDASADAMVWLRSEKHAKDRALRHAYARLTAWLQSKQPPSIAAIAQLRDTMKELEVWND